jgi:hypothetical protein
VQWGWTCKTKISFPWLLFDKLALKDPTHPAAYRCAMQTPGWKGDIEVRLNFRDKFKYSREMSISDIINAMQI